VCIKDVLIIEDAAKTFLSRAEATALEGFGWFADSYGRQMRSLESVVDQMSRDNASRDFVYPMSGACHAVMTVFDTMPKGCRPQATWSWMELTR
jgi:hypothetical protein